MINVVNVLSHMLVIVKINRIEQIVSRIGQKNNKQSPLQNNDFKYSTFLKDFCGTDNNNKKYKIKWM